MIYYKMLLIQAMPFFFFFVLSSYIYQTTSKFISIFKSPVLLTKQYEDLEILTRWSGKSNSGKENLFSMGKTKFKKKNFKCSIV